MFLMSDLNGSVNYSSQRARCAAELFLFYSHGFLVHCTALGSCLVVKSLLYVFANPYNDVTLWNWLLSCRGVM